MDAVFYSSISASMSEGIMLLCASLRYQTKRSWNATCGMDAKMSLPKLWQLCKLQVYVITNGLSFWSCNQTAQLSLLSFRLARSTGLPSSAGSLGNIGLWCIFLSSHKIALVCPTSFVRDFPQFWRILFTVLKWLHKYYADSFHMYFLSPAICQTFANKSAAI